MSSLLSSFVKPIVGLPVLGFGLVMAASAKVSNVCRGSEPSPNEKAKYMDLSSRYEGKDLSALRKHLYTAENRNAVVDGKRIMGEGLRLLSAPMVEAGLMQAHEQPQARAGLYSERDDYVISADDLKEVEAEVAETAALQFHIEKIEKQQQVLKAQESRQLTFLI